MPLAMLSQENNDCLAAVNKQSNSVCVCVCVYVWVGVWEPLTLNPKP